MLKSFSILTYYLISLLVGLTASTKYYPADDEIEYMQKVFLNKTSPPYSLIKRDLPPDLVKNFTFSKQFHPTYKWTIIATSDCMPSLDCTDFNLLPPNTATGECDKMYLEVSDGILGKERFCGSEGPKNLVAGKADGLRDLYITLKNRAAGKHPLFKCNVTCGNKTLSKHLPNVLSPIVNPKCHCGKKPTFERIIGGTMARNGEFPWIAAMVVKDTRQPFCIGSVINDRMILTAGHCFKGKFRKPWNIQIILNGFIMDPMPNIRVGNTTNNGTKKTIEYMTYDEDTLRRLDKGNNTFRYNVDQYYIHPLYNASSSDFDTGVMILDRKIDTTAFKVYSPICLPELSYVQDSYAGLTAAMSGWGLPGVNAPATITKMKQITVDIYPPKSCKTYYGDKFVSAMRQICAAYFDSSQDSCAGDSGGPLITEYRKQVWYQIGIISWGNSCAMKDSPGIYFRTTSTNQWIRHMSNEKEAVWCEVPN